VDGAKAGMSGMESPEDGGGFDGENMVETDELKFKPASSTFSASAKVKTRK
jgi:hypothetical protein